MTEYVRNLGIDSRHSALSKAHYKFPFGNFDVLHRCGLLAVKERAREFHLRRYGRRSTARRARI